VITLSWLGAPKPVHAPQPVPVAADSSPVDRRIPTVQSGCLPRSLVAVPDLVEDGVPDVSRTPLITLEVLPAAVGPGEPAEVLVMATNPRPDTLPEAWLGLVIQPGIEVSSVTSPAGTVAVTERSGAGAVVRARLSALVPGSCVGLEVSVLLPGDGPYRITAFVTPCDRAEFSLTLNHLLTTATPSPSPRPSPSRCPRPSPSR
jgi:hypothetical protein